MLPRAACWPIGALQKGRYQQQKHAETMRDSPAKAMRRSAQCWRLQAPAARNRTGGQSWCRWCSWVVGECPFTGCASNHGVLKEHMSWASLGSLSEGAWNILQLPVKFPGHLKIQGNPRVCYSLFMSSIGQRVTFRDSQVHDLSYY